MNQNSEISALMLLIDDPDEVVYTTVSNKIISMGKDIIPNLEHLWETVKNIETLERIEYLIHRVHFQDIFNSIQDWKENKGDLAEGALIISRYFYPDFDVQASMKEIEKLRRNVWLELNTYLTPIEKATVFNGIFYNYYKQTGIEISYDNHDSFLLHKALESKKGNAFSNGLIYLILASLLDLPVKAINIPRQFILGWFDVYRTIKSEHERIVFYIDPLSGQLYSHKDIINYFNKLSVVPDDLFFKPMENTEILRTIMVELSKCFEFEEKSYKKDDLLIFSELLLS
ncbi:MAG: transglutaminase family protein [Ferruginibacter sp.]